MKIVLRELEDLCNAMFARLENADLITIHFSVDFYWKPFFDDNYNQKKGSVHGIGSLFDDMEWLGNILSKERQMSFSHFEGLGGVITAIGYELEKLSHQIPADGWPVKITDIKQLCNFIFTGAKIGITQLDGQKLSIDQVDVPFDKYWRVDLKNLYIMNTLEDPPVNQHPLPNNLPVLTEHFCNGSQLSMNDFEQIGILFNAIGCSSDSILFQFINAEDEQQEKSLHENNNA